MREIIIRTLSKITGPKTLAALAAWGPASRTQFIASFSGEEARAATTIATALDAQVVKPRELFGAMADPSRRAQAIAEATNTICPDGGPKTTAIPAPPAPAPSVADEKLTRIERELQKLTRAVEDLTLSSQQPPKREIVADSELNVYEWIAAELGCGENDLEHCRQHQSLTGLAALLYAAEFNHEQVACMIGWLKDVQRSIKGHGKRR